MKSTFLNVDKQYFPPECSHPFPRHTCITTPTPVDVEMTIQVWSLFSTYKLRLGHPGPNARQRQFRRGRLVQPILDRLTTGIRRLGSVSDELVSG